MDKIIELLVKFSEYNNIILGVCEADPLIPRRYFEDAASVIVIGVGYGKKFNFGTDGKKRGILAQIAIGTDYHKTVSSLLADLDAYLRQLIPKDIPYRSKIHVDTGPLPERALALKAGLGFAGKNGNIISEKFGSLFNIGCLVTTLPIPSALPARPTNGKSCGDCTLCLNACSGGALTESGFNMKSCISYLTQKKQPLDERESKIIGSHIYGCDICQAVCPYNKNKHITEITDIELAMPDLDVFLSLSDTQLTQKYAGSAMMWRGSAVLQRNARIALENQTLPYDKLV